MPIPEPPELELDLAADAERDPRPGGGPARGRRSPSPRPSGPGAPTTAPRRPTRPGASASASSSSRASRSRGPGSARGSASAFGGGDGADWDEIEEILITGDVGAALSMDLVERARKRRDVAAPRRRSARSSRRCWPHATRPTGSRSPAAEGGPAIVLVVGVNGTGKTTTIGKLAARERGERPARASSRPPTRSAPRRSTSSGSGRSAPTSRSSPTPRTRTRPPSCSTRSTPPSPAHADIVIADTAGRLHTKSNLMDELAKVRRVIDKRLPGRRGRDVLRARRDDRPERPGPGQGVPRGGRADRRRAHEARLDRQGRHRVRDRARLGVPVRFVGVGEQADDLLPFDPEGFVAALFD